MAIQTTAIGAFPKTDCLPEFDWFQAEEGPDMVHSTAGYIAAI